MAEGAVALALDLYARGEAHGLLAIGGTMGTDLALDVTAALPLGMPKFIVATVAYSHLIPPERLAPDLMMILWAGGLYGLNGICKAILSQAAGAVVGACRSVDLARESRPRVAISSLGKSCLSYMVRLAPALVARGYEPVVFHCTGMGGRAMEALIEQRRFVAVFDFCLAEVAAGCGASRECRPVASPGRGHRGCRNRCARCDRHDHIRPALLPPDYDSRLPRAQPSARSVTSTPEERRRVAQHVAAQLHQTRGPTAFVLPLQGIRPGTGRAKRCTTRRGSRRWWTNSVAVSARRWN
jgi:uncharacterized protein (UPF0261 family)